MTGYTRPASGSQGNIITGRINEVASAYAGGNYTSTANSNVAIIQGATDTNALANGPTHLVNNNGVIQLWGTYSGAMSNFSAGTAGMALDLFRMTPGSGKALTRAPSRSPIRVLCRSTSLRLQFRSPAPTAWSSRLRSLRSSLPAVASRPMPKSFTTHPSHSTYQP